MNSKTKSNIVFSHAQISEEGVSLKNVETKEISNINADTINIISCHVSEILFSLDGSECVMMLVQLNAFYEAKWNIDCEKITIFPNYFMAYKLFVHNDRKVFLSINRVNTTGNKVSGNEFSCGYDELLGWKFSSQLISCYEGDVYFLRNKVGFHRCQLNIPNICSSIHEGSGFISVPFLRRDLNDDLYMYFSYYFFSQYKDFDILVTPMIYSRSIGGQVVFKDINRAVSVDVYSEKFFSWKKDEKDKKDNIVRVQSSNKVVDADFIIFNTSMFNKMLYRKFLYRDFRHLNNMYFGYCMIDLDRFQISATQIDDKFSLKEVVKLTSFFKFEIIHDIENKTYDIKSILFKNWFKNFNLFMIDFEGKFSHQTFKECELSKWKASDCELSTMFYIGFPIIAIKDAMFIQTGVKFEIKGEILELGKYFANQIKTKFNLNQSDIKKKIIFDGDIFINDSEIKYEFSSLKNYFISISSDFKIIDDIFIERIEGKTFIGCMFLHDNQSYGFKINKEQVIMDVSFKFMSYFSFKLIASAALFDKFKLDKENEKTYLNFILSFNSNAWEINLHFGYNNFSKNKWLLCKVDIHPKPLYSMNDLYQIEADLKKEKEKIFKLYDEFK